ncbi:Caudovirus prohead serine protease [anaerobic digester metagenome]
MKIEIRADNSVLISGYVNAVERESRPVITPHGKVVEMVESGVFRAALERAENINMSVDHDPNKVVASTKEGLSLYEDNIGLRAEAVVTDPETVENARKGKIKGWSFGMRKVVDTLEERAGKLPLRHIKGMELDHITLTVKKKPCYSATSVELRADEEERLELRCEETDIITKEEKRAIDYSSFENKLKKIKGA